VIEKYKHGRVAEKAKTVGASTFFVMCPQCNKERTVGFQQMWKIERAKNKNPCAECSEKNIKKNRTEKAKAKKKVVKKAKTVRPARIIKPNRKDNRFVNRTGAEIKKRSKKDQEMIRKFLKNNKVTVIQSQAPFDPSNTSYKRLDY